MFLFNPCHPCFTFTVTSGMCSEQERSFFQFTLRVRLERVPQHDKPVAHFELRHLWPLFGSGAALDGQQRMSHAPNGACCARGDPGKKSRDLARCSVRASYWPALTARHHRTTAFYRALANGQGQLYNPGNRSCSAGSAPSTGRRGCLKASAGENRAVWSSTTFALLDGCDALTVASCW